MKFTVAQDKLVAGLQSLISVVPTKSTFPILSNVLLDAQEKRLLISATDLEVAAITQVEAKASSAGSVTVPARQFAEIVKQLPSMPVEIEAAENRVTIKCDRSRFSIVGLPKDDFPKMPELKKEKSFKVSGGILQTIIKKTLFAVANDSSRPALCGVFMQMNGDNLKVVTTDGRRLAMFETMIPPVSHKSELLLSPKGLNVVNRMLGGEDKEITVQFDDSYSKFSFEGTTIYARHIEGTYPDYEKVIPSGNKKVLAANVELFTAAVKRVAILSDTFTYQIKLSLKDDSIELSSQTVDIGEAKETMAASYKGDEMEIGYNASYLLDILKNLDGDELNMYLNTPLSAGLIKPSKQPEDYKLTYLLMPLRLPE